MKKLIVSALMFAPVFAFAQNQPNLSYLTNLMGTIRTLVNMALPLVVGLALLGFFWGLVKFIWGGDGDKEKAKSTMIWGIVALFVMVSVWGLVNFLGSVVGVQQQGGTVNVPTVNGI